MMTPQFELKDGYTIYNPAAVRQLQLAPDRRHNMSASPMLRLISMPVVIPAVLANRTSRALQSLVL
jgi:hypothetical protein